MCLFFFHDKFHRLKMLDFCKPSPSAIPQEAHQCSAYSGNRSPVTIYTYPFITFLIKHTSFFYLFFTIRRSQLSFMLYECLCNGIIVKVSASQTNDKPRRSSNRFTALVQSRIHLPLYETPTSVFIPTLLEVPVDF